MAFSSHRRGAFLHLSEQRNNVIRERAGSPGYGPPAPGSILLPWQSTQLTLRVTVARLGGEHRSARMLVLLTWAAHLFLCGVGTRWCPDPAGKGQKQVPKPAQPLTRLGLIAVAHQQCSLTPRGRLPADLLSKVGAFRMYQGLFLLFTPFFDCIASVICNNKPTGSAFSNDCMGTAVGWDQNPWLQI